MEETLGWIDHLIAVRTPAYIVTANLDFATQSSEDVELQRILVEAELVLCDGTPLVWASRFTGKPLRERVAGSDLVPQIAALAEKRGYRIFLLGGDPAILEKAAFNLEQTHPLLPKIQYYSPPFAPLHEFDNRAIAEKIKAARPDILLVAFGCPKQEKWIYMHYRKLGVPCCIGVGATVDFLAGKVSRAPAWIARFGLEWIYRMVQEPKRLVGRYAKDLLFLVCQSWRESRAISAANAPSVGAPFFQSAETPPSGLETIRWQGALTAARLEYFPSPTFEEPFLIDLSAVHSMDSRGLGLMLRIIRTAWAKDLAGCFLAPTNAVKLVIEVTRLNRVLPLADTMEEAHHQIAIHSAAARLRPVAGEAEGVLLINLPPRITAETAESCGQAVRVDWENRPNIREVVFDLSETIFIDSSGLGFLLRCHRMVAQREGGILRLVHLQDNIRNVICVAKLEGVLMKNSLNPHPASAK